MAYDLELKVGDVENIGAVLSLNGQPFNLSGCTVSYTLESMDKNTRFDIACTLGGYVNGQYVAASAGGATVPFASADTATPGQFQGEFVVTDNNGNIVHVPSGNVYHQIMIWPAL
jgi:hypothetical protein